jgi:hypothetical protein
MPLAGRITLEFVSDIPNFQYSGIMYFSTEWGAHFGAVDMAWPQTSRLWELGKELTHPEEHMFLRGICVAVLISSAALAAGHRPVCPGLPLPAARAAMHAW